MRVESRERGRRQFIRGGGKLYVCLDHRVAWWVARLAFAERVAELANYDDQCRAGHACGGYQSGPRQEAAEETELGLATPFDRRPRAAGTDAPAGLVRRVWLRLLRALLLVSNDSPQGGRQHG